MHQNESDDAIACHLGTRVRKNHTSKRSAFETIGSSPAYIIFENTVQDNTVGRNLFSENDYTPRISFGYKSCFSKISSWI